MQKECEGRGKWKTTRRLRVKEEILMILLAVIIIDVHMNVKLTIVLYFCIGVKWNGIYYILQRG